MVRRETYWVDYQEGLGNNINKWVVLHRGRTSRHFVEIEYFDTRKEAVKFARKKAKSEKLPSKLKVERKNSRGLSEESNYGG